LHVGNCVINCFKWFSNVARAKPFLANFGTGMRAALFNIQIRELDVGKLSIDLRKWVYHGKRIV